MMADEHEHHPLVYLVRGHLRHHAAAARAAIVAYETVLALDPDNDAKLDEIAAEFNQATHNLTVAVANYRTVRDIEGLA